MEDKEDRERVTAGKEELPLLALPFMSFLSSPGDRALFRPVSHHPSSLPRPERGRTRCVLLLTCSSLNKRQQLVMDEARPAASPAARKPAPETPWPKRLARASFPAVPADGLLPQETGQPLGRDTGRGKAEGTGCKRRTHRLSDREWLKVFLKHSMSLSLSIF